MRWRCVRLGLGALLGLVGLTSFLYTLTQAPPGQPFSHEPPKDTAPRQAALDGEDKEDPSSDISTIPCVINGELLSSGRCLRDSEEIYVPFRALVQPAFEISGFLESSEEAGERFVWWHNASRITRPPDEAYKTDGAFGPFASYNVEGRARVRCINGESGMPMSTQWGRTPYYYPVQIGQFALQHFSKMVTSTSPPRTADLLSTAWQPPTAASARSEGGLRVSAPVDSDGAVLSVPESAQDLPLLLLDLRLEPTASLSLRLSRLDTGEEVTLRYRLGHDGCLGPSEAADVFVHGLGRKGDRRTLIRNLPIDAAKLIGAQDRGKAKLRIPPEQLRLRAIVVHGEVELFGARLSSSAHREQFLQAAEWLFEAQDERGGWPVPVRRSLAKERLVLEPGWYSAMGQGHAMSVLARAFLLTEDRRFVAAAKRAADLFQSPASEGGLVNRVLTQVAWYEEYPTTPGSFVLNGFLYSLFGLADLATVAKDSLGPELLEQGLASLDKLVGLYDSGSGSFYDLRHLSLPGLPPNRARSDYHTLHVYQLLWLSNLVEDPKRKKLYKDTAQRWIGYALGKRAKHN